jgi:hypothetical protein
MAVVELSTIANPLEITQLQYLTHIKPEELRDNLNFLQVALWNFDLNVLPKLKELSENNFELKGENFDISGILPPSPLPQSFENLKDVIFFILRSMNRCLDKDLALANKLRDSLRIFLTQPETEVNHLGGLNYLAPAFTAEPISLTAIKMFIEKNPLPLPVAMPAVAQAAVDGLTLTDVVPNPPAEPVQEPDIEGAAAAATVSRRTSSQRQTSTLRDSTGSDSKGKRLTQMRGYDENSSYFFKISLGRDLHRILRECKTDVGKQNLTKKDLYTALIDLENNWYNNQGREIRLDQLGLSKEMIDNLQFYGAVGDYEENKSILVFNNCDKLIVGILSYLTIDIAEYAEYRRTSLIKKSPAEVNPARKDIVTTIWRPLISDKPLSLPLHRTLLKYASDPTAENSLNIKIAISELKNQWKASSAEGEGGTEILLEKQDLPPDLISALNEYNKRTNPIISFWLINNLEELTKGIDYYRTTILPVVVEPPQPIVTPSVSNTNSHTRINNPPPNGFIQWFRANRPLAIIALALLAVGIIGAAVFIALPLITGASVISAPLIAFCGTAAFGGIFAAKAGPVKIKGGFFSGAKQWAKANPVLAGIAITLLVLGIAGIIAASIFSFGAIPALAAVAVVSSNIAMPLLLAGCGAVAVGGVCVAVTKTPEEIPMKTTPVSEERSTSSEDHVVGTNPHMHPYVIPSQPPLSVVTAEVLPTLPLANSMTTDNLLFTTTTETHEDEETAATLNLSTS